MIVEYRTWTSVADVPFGNESKWLPLIRHLESKHGELGPIATWKEDASAIVLILSDEHPDPASAAESATRVVSDALHASGLANRFPTVFQVEPVANVVAAA